MSTQSTSPLMGQADTVLASLERQTELSPRLRIEIEEAIETAWEIALRRPPAPGSFPRRDAGVVVSFKDHRRVSR